MLLEYEIIILTVINFCRAIWSSNADPQTIGKNKSKFEKKIVNRHRKPVLCETYQYLFFFSIDVPRSSHLDSFNNKKCFGSYLCGISFGSQNNNSLVCFFVSPLSHHSTLVVIHKPFCLSVEQVTNMSTG